VGLDWSDGYNLGIIILIVSSGPSINAARRKVVAISGSDFYRIIDTAREVRTYNTSEEHHTNVSAVREVRAHQTLICTESYPALDSHRGNELLLGAVAEASKANYALCVYVGCIWGRCEGGLPHPSPEITP